jgi:2-polyprenyl-3-methyl-5-hydroxy-6-metoxy-1,4-benzoquinol methylase
VGDVRDAGGVVGRVVTRLDTFNRRHPWSHNAHFHGWILRRLPDLRRQALDVGCGRGELLGLLASRFLHVDGIDVDAEMARASRERFASDDRASILQTSFDQMTGRYDLITMVAVLHHLDLEPALRHACELLTDGGRLIVVGLARVTTPLDVAWDLASALLNPVMGMIKHPHTAHGGDIQPRCPTVEPTLTFGEIKAVAHRTLPGVRLHRRLFFRYTLEWTRH